MGPTLKFALQGAGCTHLASLSSWFDDGPQTVVLPCSDTVPLTHLRIHFMASTTRHTLQRLHAASQLTSLELHCDFPSNFNLQHHVPGQLSNASLPENASWPACMHSLHTVRFHSLSSGLPAALLAYTALRELDLSKYNYIVLPESLGNLSQLTKLVATSDKMIEVPSCVLKLRQLVALKS